MISCGGPGAFVVRLYVNDPLHPTSNTGGLAQDQRSTEWTAGITDHAQLTASSAYHLVGSQRVPAQWQAAPATWPPLAVVLPCCCGRRAAHLFAMLMLMVEAKHGAAFRAVGAGCGASPEGTGVRSGRLAPSQAGRNFQDWTGRLAFPLSTLPDGL
eukprot:jgi/Ulvmu1/6978/UM033_0036.1